jgi:hypothetical protein
MATKKKAKKTKSRKKVKKSAKKRLVARKKPTARKKKVVKKPARKKVKARKKPAAKKKSAARRSAAPKTARKSAAPTLFPAAKPPVSMAPPGTQRVGIVTHYYTHLGVAIIEIESGMLREGDTVHIKGHTSDFRQRVESMEIDHTHVFTVMPGQVFGMKVREHAREHDAVYKVISP